MKFRVDRDVLADAVAWAARSLPVRPSVPVLSGLLIDASDEGLVLSTFDYETSARATLKAEVSDEGRPWSAAGCWPTSAAACRPSRSRWCSTAPRVSLTCGSARFSLQTMPVEDYPTLPDMPAATGTVAERRVRARRRPGGHRRRPRRHAAGADRRADRDRRARRSRCWPPTGSGSPTASSTGAPHAPTSRSAALVPARVLGDTAKSLTAGSEVTIALAASRLRRGHHRVRGPAAGGVRRTTTRLLDGEFPKVRSLFPSEHQTVARSTSPR